MKKIVTIIAEFLSSEKQIKAAQEQYINGKKKNSSYSDCDALKKCQILLKIMKENNPFWV